MTIAVIGLGRAGRRWARIAETQGHRVVSYDARSPRDDFDDILQAANAVIVATPPDTHFGYTYIASAYNKPVLVEKPISDRVVPWPNSFIMPVTSYRFHPQVQAARFDYEEGDEVRVVYCEPIENWQAETYTRDADFEARIHFVDLLYWFGGPSLAERHRELVTIDYRTKGERYCRLTVSGKPFDLLPTDEVHVRQFSHFIECVNGLEIPICPMSEAVAILEIALS